MALQSAIEKYNSLQGIVGKTMLNAMFPKDFEAYIIAFELVDWMDRTIEFFAIPIMPSNISISESEVTNIKKTNKGVTSIKTDSFIPKDISLQGNFGKNLKFLIRNKLIDVASFKSGLKMLVSSFMGTRIKTGFGTTKIFQQLLEDSKGTVGGFPVKLYFYNFAFSENYVVEVIDKTFTQEQGASNMMWNYSVSLRAVAPINNSLKSKKSLLSIVSASLLQKGINNLSSKIKQSLPLLNPPIIKR